jgi:predicted adenine nucleotide alpha hydrolase (AANH) superfamily ATPase
MSFLGFNLTKEDIESFERLYKKLHQKQQSYLESEITQIWIDDAKQLEDSKKKHKPKQQMPYWANNWRKK